MADGEDLEKLQEEFLAAKKDPAAKVVRVSRSQMKPVGKAAGGAAAPARELAVAPAPVAAARPAPAAEASAAAAPARPMSKFKQQMQAQRSQPASSSASAPAAPARSSAVRASPSKSASAVDPVEQSERLQPGSSRGISAEERSKISAENAQKLAAMSDDQVLEAQREIMSMLSPAHIAMLRNRQKQREDGGACADSNSVSSAAPLPPKPAASRPPPQQQSQAQAQPRAAPAPSSRPVEVEGKEYRTQMSLRGERFVIPLTEDGDLALADVEPARAAAAAGDDELYDDAEADAEFDDDARARLEEHDHLRGPQVVSSILERDVSQVSFAMPRGPAFGGFPASRAVASGSFASAPAPGSAAPAPGKQSLFAAQLAKSRAAAQPLDRLAESVRLSTGLVTVAPAAASAVSSNRIDLTKPRATAPEVSEQAQAGGISAEERSKISAENAQKLAAMSDDQVLEAQREIMSMLSPAHIAMLRNRQKQREDGFAADSAADAKSAPPSNLSLTPADSSTAKASSKADSKSPAAVPLYKPSASFEEGDDGSLLTVPTSDEPGVTQREEWMKPVAAPDEQAQKALDAEKKKHLVQDEVFWSNWRVDFDGVYISAVSSADSSGI